MIKILPRNMHKYYLEKVKEIQEKLLENVYPPVFKVEKWKNSNCYSYALGINVSDPKQAIWIPGCICDESANKHIWTDVTSKVKKDLEFLGISYRENTKQLKDGEWRIAIYFRPTPHDWPIEFHISRQDADEIWSEKKNWKDQPQKIGGKSDNPPDLSKYQLYLENILILSKN